MLPLCKTEWQAKPLHPAAAVHTSRILELPVSRECPNLLQPPGNTKSRTAKKLLEVPSSCSVPSSCTVKKKWICVETFFWYYSFFECDSVPPKPRAAHWKPESKPSHFALSQLQLGKARVHANREYAQVDFLRFSDIFRSYRACLMSKKGA